MYRLIEARGKTPAGAPRDLLDRLIAARDSETGIGMTDHEIRDEVVIIFLAGHETTANALSWTWLLLGQHPEIEEKLVEELRRVLAGRAPTAADSSRRRAAIQCAKRIQPRRHPHDSKLRRTICHGNEFGKSPDVRTTNLFRRGDLQRVFAHFPFGPETRVLPAC